MASASEDLDPRSGRGLLFLAILVLVNVVNFVDRQLPFILISSIKADLKLSDTEIGLMAGLTFAIVYSLAGLGLARLADKGSPRAVLAVSLMFWSLMTAMTGLARNFGQLLGARVAVAAGEAGSTPTSHALIARLYAADKRTIALALYSMGVPIGSMLGLALGGWINDLTNWRTAFFIVGLPGLALALIAWRVLPDVPRSPALAHDTTSYRQSLRHLFRDRSYVHMVAASSLFACGSYAINVFAPAFLMRVHGVSATAAGISIGLAFGVGGGLGTFAGGYLADRLGRGDPRWLQWIPMIGQLLSIPAALAAWLIDGTTASIVFLALTYMSGLLYFSPTFSAAQMLVPDNLRATASAVLLFGVTFVGSSVGPLVVGAVSDALAPGFGPAALRYGLCLMAITMAWSALHYHFAARALPRDLLRAATRSQAKA